jgi:hypothetical protein
MNFFPQKLLRSIDIQYFKLLSIIGSRHFMPPFNTNDFDADFLDINGFLYIKDFLKNHLNSSFEATSELKDLYQRLKSLSSFYDCQSFRRNDLHNFQSVFDVSFLSMTNFKRVDFRGKNSGIDENMIDLFFIRKFADIPHDSRSSGDNLISNIDTIHDKSLSVLADFFSKIGYKYTHSNLYLYQGVEHPRCLHIDSFVPHFKAMIILKDVSLSTGPYSFIPKSHRYHFRRLLSISLNRVFGSSMGNHKNDMTIFSSFFAKRFTAQLGSLIITNQSGVHGDFPARDIHQDKYSLVLNFAKRNSQ